MLFRPTIISIFLLSLWKNSKVKVLQIAIIPCQESEIERLKQPLELSHRRNAHLPGLDGDFWGCLDGRVWDFCWTCFVKSSGKAVRIAHGASPGWLIRISPHSALWSRRGSRYWYWQRRTAQHLFASLGPLPRDLGSQAWSVPTQPLLKDKIPLDFHRQIPFLYPRDILVTAWAVLGWSGAPERRKTEQRPGSGLERPAWKRNPLGMGCDRAGMQRGRTTTHPSG